MEFCPLDLTMPGGRAARADSSLLSQLSFESGLAERLTDFTDGWSGNSSASRGSKLVDRRLCHEGAPGYVQQDNNSSSTCSELLETPALHNNRAGKRKAVTDLAMTISTNSGKVDCSSASSLPRHSFILQLL